MTTTVNLTKPASTRAFRMTDVEALGRSFVPLVTVAGVLHNRLDALSELFATGDDEIVRRCGEWSVTQPAPPWMSIFQD